MGLQTTTVAFLVLCAAWLSNGQKIAKIRRPIPLLSKQQLFIPSISIQRPTLPPPTSATASHVEVQQAEVHSEEFLPSHELQGPPPTILQPQFQVESQPRPQPQFPPQQKQFRSSGRSSNSKEYVTPIPIISLSKQQSLDGSYKTSYETANSIQAEETGFLKNIGVPEQEALVQFGSYSYTDPDGKQVSVTYTADEGGFRATGDHLPTPPPVPPEVQKGLDIIYESIRQEALRQAKEKKLKSQKLESQNYPVDTENGRLQRQ
ncbi:endocuticle structural glycoprotein SgAbd-1 [Halyomorpha halys]|uniref:endocuticle structural glycoprotein SgAbd-1 n=1 Tax=Halyomorpha halys TaxID=286706 RepID=UPI0006D51EE4|nr:endocuticle structural glycoprotein SgAbd-1 [Halyomorpha halys]KAE8574106.1 Cuticle Protein CPR RR-1 [Halyomorpha halys]